MRLAVISDVQGNAVALDAVLKHIHSEVVDEIVCLGDIATGPEPAAVVEMLREQGCLSVRGNMDAVVLAPEPYRGTDNTARRYAEIDQWCSVQLGQSDRDYLASLPLTLDIDLSDTIRCLCCHGSPRSNEDVIDATTSDARLAELLAGVEARLVFTGHMHDPMLRHFGDIRIINPGSVGLPFGGKRLMPTRAEYAIIDCAGDDVTICFRTLSYDSELFRRHVLASGMPHAAWYLAKWQL